jgi:hypothetical protein
MVYSLREVEARQFKTSSQSGNGAKEASQLPCKSLMSASNSTGHTLDFIHYGSSDSVKINGTRTVKDVENLGNGFTEFLGDLAFFGSELGSRFVLRGEIGGSFEETD